ncbi:MAG: hypothetical protein KDJ38_07265 [Gammaproteobacteria bacterium]|nr:hypothetical protein [Gammaproteobacteria bacterium]
MKSKLTVSERLMNLFELMGRARVRQELLKMNPRLLVDLGYSLPLLKSGVSAWPWRAEDDYLQPPLSFDNRPQAQTLAQPAPLPRVA